jgi:hypothetical protein
VRSDRRGAQRHPPPCFAGIGRAEHHVGDQAKRDEVLDRLVGRAVLAETDRVVCENVGDRQLHYGSQPHRRPKVVGEDQERRHEGAHAAVQREPVGDPSHGVLADAEVQVASRKRVGRHRGLSRDQGVGRGRKVS